MEDNLIKKFETNFKPVDKRVKEEEIILFLDKQTPQKFDRQTFNELRSRIEDRQLEFTALNFARTYYDAYELLEIKKQRTFMDINHIDRMSQKLKAERGKSFSKVVFTALNVESPSDSSNYFTFEQSPDMAINFYDFWSEEPKFLLLPDSKSNEKIPIRITLFSPQGKMIDSKNVSLAGKESQESMRVKFNDGSALNFSSTRVPISVTDCQRELGEMKTETSQYEVFVKEKREYLASMFPDVFSSTLIWKTKSVDCGFYLIGSCVLSLIIGLIAFYLNFTRCMFLDILVVLSFFSKLYIWRVFNLFLAVKLICVLIVSVCLDLSWEIHKAISFNKKYEATVKSERIKGLILTGFIIVVKLGLIFFYYKLSRENNSKGFLGLDSEMSINEVEAEDYMMRPVASNANIFK